MISYRSFRPHRYRLIMRRAPRAFTLIEIMIVIAILGLILGIAAPIWFRQRSLSQQRVCQENLIQIDGAKEVWALEHHEPPDAVPGWDDLVQADGTGYLKVQPVCPNSGTYTLGTVTDRTTCTVNGLYDHNEGP